MAVNVQRKSGGRVAEIFLYGLHVVAVLQGEHGEGVAQIMHTGVRCACFGCDLLVMGIKTLRVQVVAEQVRENEPTGGVLLGGAYPVLPQITGL